MKARFFKSFIKIFFWVGCVIFTIDRVKTCFDIYKEDASYSNTEYREFLSDDSPYPSISVCIKEPYLADQMRHFNVTNGQYANPEFKEIQDITRLYMIPYEKITLHPDARNFRLRSIIYLKNKTAIFYKFKPFADPTLRDKYFKCFSFDFTDVPEKINKVQVDLNINDWPKDSVEVASYIHLPGLFRESRRYEMVNDAKLGSIIVKKIIDLVEIYQLRNTEKTPCDEHQKEFDGLLVKDILEKVGCKPYYMQEKEYTMIKNCSSSKEITKLNRKLDIKNTFSTFKEFRFFC